MSILTEQLNKILKEKGLSHRKLAKIVDEHDSSINSMIRSIRAFPEDVIHKIAPILEISPETIKGWILVGKYPENILKMAFKVKQEMPKKKGMLILTRKIDEILGQKGVSRTGASTIIGYRQGKLNEMIIGKKPMSPLVISKLAPFLEVSEEQIRAWIVADKYSLEALQAANM